jgi:phosphatidylglycerophosphate synthase
MANPPWDQRLARVLVKPLVKSPVTPNQLTVFTLLVALAGAGLLAHGGQAQANWGAGIFVLARFMDHFDGELARQKGMTSRLGYYLDYVSGALSYGALFLGIGIGLRESGLGPWAIGLGAVGALSAVVSMFTNLDIDKHTKETATPDKDAVGYPAFAGFELEDGIYLIAPITWLGFLVPFFVLAGIGSAVYCLWTGWTLVRLRRR